MVQRPRVRTTTGEEVELPSWAAWSSEDPLEQRAIEQMLLGVSTRKVRPLAGHATGGDRVAGHGQERGEPPVRARDSAPTALLERDLSGLDLKSGKP